MSDISGSGSDLATARTGQMWNLSDADLAGLSERWGEGRIEEALIAMARATDYQGLVILLEPTVEHIEKYMAALYCPDMVTLAEFEVVKTFDTILIPPAHQEADS